MPPSAAATRPSLAESLRERPIVVPLRREDTRDANRAFVEDLARLGFQASRVRSSEVETDPGTVIWIKGNRSGTGSSSTGSPPLRRTVGRA